MAFTHGKNAYVSINGNDITDFCDSAQLQQPVDTAESSTFGSEAKSYLSGMSDGTFSIAGKYDSNVSEIQRIAASGTVSGGTYTITFSGQTTSSLNHNDSNATVVAALNALSNVASGDIVLGGGARSGTAVTATFAQAYLGVDVPLMTINSGSLTGGGSYVVSTTQQVGPDETLALALGLDSPIAFIFGPEGSASNDVKYSGNCIMTAYNCTAPVGDVVAFTAEFQITGAITKGAF